ncbi:hypothetical protein ACP4OV_007207 [Aristida adscensionis]
MAPTLIARSLPPWCSAWSRAAAGAASAALAAAVFAFLDAVDVLLCLAYALLDGLLEDGPPACYCHRGHDAGKASSAASGTAATEQDDDEEEVSDTLYVRRSACKDALMWLLRMVTRRSRAAPAPGKLRSPRWSDCGCASCVAWREDGDGRLHFVVKEPAPKDTSGTASSKTEDDSEAAATEDAIFIHGFLSSSSFWTETVFREPSAVLRRRRLLAVDLLSFGRSPKPANCLYRLKDHVDAIERSLVEPLHLTSFHLVAHSMGCIVALALAARHPARVKSITLVAPPYFPACEQEASRVALRRLAAKKLWPPLLFVSSVMSWYEHIGRTVCLLVCKNHLRWEWLIRLLTGKREVDYRMRDLTRHTHQSAWHTMHNVVCGGARLQGRYLDAVAAAGVPVRAVHGGDDTVVPAECSRHLKARLPAAELRLLGGRDHATVVLGREREFADELVAFWSCSASRRGQGAQANGR